MVFVFNALIACLDSTLFLLKHVFKLSQARLQTSPIPPDLFACRVVQSLQDLGLGLPIQGRALAEGEARGYVGGVVDRKVDDE